MFKTPNVYAMVQGFAVRPKDERENDKNHLVETEFEMMLTHALADEIMPAMARDLFQEVSGEWLARPEMKEAVFVLTPGKQNVTVAVHPDTDQMKLAGVTIRNIRAVKTDAGTWALRFKCTWQFTLDSEAILMIRNLRQGLYLTMEAQQPSILDDAQQDTRKETQPKLANIKDKPKRKRKATPEDEAGVQAAEGAARAADDTGGDPAGDQPPATE